MFKPAADLDQRPHRVPQAQQIAPQQIQPLDLRPRHRARQHQILHRFDFFLDGFEHRRVVIDDEIEDGVEDVVLAAGQRPWAAFAACAHRRVGCRGAVANRDKVTFTDEQMGFAECDAVAHELRGARHDEQTFTILLDLRSLVRVVRVFDGEIVQLELALHARQERHVRFMQSDPDHVAGPATPARGFLDGDVGDTPAIDIGAGSDDAFGSDGIVRDVRLRSYGHGFHPSMIAAETCPTPCFRARLAPGNLWSNVCSAAYNGYCQDAFPGCQPKLSLQTAS